MKATILILLVIAVALLSAILVLLFLPGASYQASGPSLRSRQAAVGRAVLAAARSDLNAAEMVKAAVRVAPDDDRVLAAHLVADLPAR